MVSLTGARGADPVPNRVGDRTPGTNDHANGTETAAFTLASSATRRHNA